MISRNENESGPRGRGGGRGRGRGLGRGRGSGRRGLGSCSGRCSLRDLPAGYRAQVLEVSGELDVAARLRELGLLEGAQVLVIRQSDPMLVVLQDARIALDHHLALGIEVEPLGA